MRIVPLHAVYLIYGNTYMPVCLLHQLPTTHIISQALRSGDADTQPQPPRKWVRYAIIGGVLVAAAVIAIIVVFTTTTWGSDTTKSALTLDDLFNGRLTPKRASGTWLNGGAGHERLQFNANGDLVLYNVHSDTERRVLGAAAPGLTGSYTQQLSADGRFVLLEHYHEQVFRHSRRSTYQLYAVNGTQPIGSVSTSGSTVADVLLDYATFGPRDSQLAFVQNQNLYYMPTATQPDAIVAITNTSSAAVFNGICDWAYEEEIFGRARALWFSPDGQRLAYAQFDDTNVRTVTMWHFGRPIDGTAALDSQYPGAQHISYPKVGTVNPHVRLLWVRLPNASIGVGVPAVLPVPQRLAVHSAEEPVLTAVDWTDNETVLAVWMNRQQNRAYVEEYATTTIAESTQIFDVTSNTGWLDMGEPLFVNRQQQQIALVRHVQDHKHIVTHSTLPATRGQERQLTSGAFNVQRILHWNVQDDVVFYLGNTMEAPQDQQLYAVFNGNGSVHCVTCGAPFAQQYTHFDAQFSVAGNDLVLVSQGPAVPRYDAYEWIAHSASIRLVRPLEANGALAERLRTVAEPLVRYMEVPLSEPDAAGVRYTARVRLLLPPGFDAAAKVPYPMLVHVYGGPSTYAGSSAWTLGYSAFMATNRSMVVAQIDGRGSERRDLRTLHAVYRQLGRWEVADQIDVAR